MNPHLASAIIEATVPSDVVGRSSNCESRANEKIETKLFKNDMPVLGLAGCHDGKRNGHKTEIEIAGIQS